jgi:6-phosphogluconolactonase
MAVELRVQDGPDQVAAAALEVIVSAVRDAIAQRGVAHVSLAGGNTPKRTYEQLAGALGSWENVELWFNDERAVPPDDPQSNFKMVAEALGGHPTLHRVAGEADPEAASQAYEREMRARIESTAEAGMPVIDLHVLGIGEDGHTASLFPGHPEVEIRDRLVVPVHNSPKPPPTRITMTLPVLQVARQRLFLATGADKAGPVSVLVSGPNPDYPSSLVGGENTVVIADPAAAGR